MSDPEIDALFDALLADFEAIDNMHGTDGLVEQGSATLHQLHAEWPASSDELDVDLANAILIGPRQDND